MYEFQLIYSITMRIHTFGLYYSAMGCVRHKQILLVLNMTFVHLASLIDTLCAGIVSGYRVPPPWSLTERILSCTEAENHLRRLRSLENFWELFGSKYFLWMFCPEFFGGIFCSGIICEDFYPGIIWGDYLSRNYLSESWMTRSAVNRYQNFLKLIKSKSCWTLRC